MKDFCNIPISINFIGGAFVDIQDSLSEKYLIEYIKQKHIIYYEDFK